LAALSPTSTKGDDDPLDICVVSERPINKAEVLLNARVVGGLQGVDHGEADDKIIAVLENDNIWGSAANLEDLPEVLIERYRHYFSTYKQVPGEESKMSIESVYDIDHAVKVVEAALADYDDYYGQ
jgi:inorganic pyrophosphatase